MLIQANKQNKDRLSLYLTFRSIESYVWRFFEIEDPAESRSGHGKGCRLKMMEVVTLAVIRLLSSFYYCTTSVNRSASSKRPVYFRMPSGMLKHGEHFESSLTLEGERHYAQVSATRSRHSLSQWHTVVLRDARRRPPSRTHPRWVYGQEDVG